MKRKKISLAEIDAMDSPYMRDLTQRFLDEYGDKLDKIIERSIKTNGRFVDIETDE
jgi:hypothetical protein